MPERDSSADASGVNSDTSNDNLTHADVRDFLRFVPGEGWRYTSMPDANDVAALLLERDSLSAELADAREMVTIAKLAVRRMTSETQRIDTQLTNYEHRVIHAEREAAKGGGDDR